MRDSAGLGSTNTAAFLFLVFIVPWKKHRDGISSAHFRIHGIFHRKIIIPIPIPKNGTASETPTSDYVIPASKAFVLVISCRLQRWNCELFFYFTIFFKCQMPVVNVTLQSSVIISRLKNKYLWKPFYNKIILQYKLLQ